jgi:nitrate/TMAO reductase-like tetraheme cytochrome c subunit
MSEREEQTDHQLKLIFLMTAGAISIILMVIGIYQLVEFTDSTAFCGRLCHDVMYPEFTTYQASPHSRVTCSACHVGSGADYLVRSKISGIPLIFATMTGNYEKPIPVPVRSLRPARYTCEQCHRPEVFFGDVVKVHTTFLPDENNTQKTDSRIMRVGGGESGVARDTHWHIVARVWYIASDEERQNIVWVGVENETGEIETEYVYREISGEISEIPKDQAKHLMDCIDCHNRITHIFNSPEELIDTAMVQGKIDDELPYIKRESIKALDPPSSSLDEAFVKIEAIEDFYRTDYPEIYNEKQQKIQEALDQLREVARLTTFPYMDVTYKTYLDNINHLEAPSCMRCHGKLIATSGERAGMAIDVSCDLCHEILQ